LAEGIKCGRAVKSKVKGGWGKTGSNQRKLRMWGKRQGQGGNCRTACLPLGEVRGRVIFRIRPVKLKKKKGEKKGGGKKRGDPRKRDSPRKKQTEPGNGDGEKKNVQQGVRQNGKNRPLCGNVSEMKKSNKGKGTKVA